MEPEVQELIYSPTGRQTHTVRSWNNDNTATTTCGRTIYWPSVHEAPAPSCRMCATA